jgi:hypothetical protein
MAALFDVMHAKLKLFRNYVNREVKQSLLPSLRLEVCREIHSHLSPLRILKVLDSFNQSLNQVIFFLNDLLSRNDF